MSIANEMLSNITHYMKYSKYLSEKKRREVFSETIHRNKEMHKQKYPNLAKDIDYWYTFVESKTILPAMRSLQFGGEAIMKNNARIFNCSYQPINHYKAFSQTMFLLLSGVGKGYSVQNHHIKELPNISTPTESFEFIVEDDIEGWADSIEALVKAYFGLGALPLFNFSKVRNKGSRLVTSGGKAPGSEPLKKCLQEIQKVFINVLISRGENSKLESIDCHSIQCHIADAVLSGGIRRAAMICLFDYFDMKMRRCKSGNWWETNPHFARANNSIVCDYNEITYDMYIELWKDVVNSGSGEPGFYWTFNKDVLTNPCFTGDTLILSDKGYVKIGDNIGELNLINRNGDIVKGSIWSSGFKPVIELTLSNKKKIKCTENHIFLTVNEVELQAKDLLNHKIKQYTKKPHNLDFSDCFIKYGFLQGDGNLTRLSSEQHKGLEVNIGKKDKELFNLFDIPNTPNKRAFYVTGYNNHLKQLKFSSKALPERCLPLSINDWIDIDKLSFLRGLYSANGSVIKNHRVALKSTCLELIKGVKDLLFYFGIDSYFTTNKSKKVSFKNGDYICKESYDLNIAKIDSIIKFSELIGFVQEYKNINLYSLIDLKSPIVQKITNLQESQEVFDFNLQDNTHWGVIEGVIAHNCGEASLYPKTFCNLVDINASKISNQEHFNEVCKVASSINTLQAGYTDFHYLDQEWKQNTERDALIGVGITGIASGTLDNLDLGVGSNIVKIQNYLISQKIGINQAKRSCMIKPAGTSSLILGTSSGIHDWYDEYYFRRVRVNKNEPIYQYLKDKLPFLIEDDVYDSLNSAVITFPQKAPENAKITKNSTALDILERTKRFNLEWIRNSHVDGDNFHNVSATVQVKDHEWDIVGQWIWDNRYDYHGLTVLPFENHTYKQAPFESCSKQDFDKYYSFLKDLDLSEIVEEDDNTNLTDQVACYGGSCSLL